MRLLLLTVSALVYLAASSIAALYVIAVGVYDCYESCAEFDRHADWWDRQDSWQWTAIAVLGLAAGVVGTLFFLALVARRRPAILWSTLGIYAAVLFAASAFLLPAGWGTTA